jgi:hypothetical protein
LPVIGGRQAPGVPLAAARIAVGALLLIRTTGIARALALFPAGDVLLGWPDASGPGLGALLPLPAGLVAAACVTRTLAAALFMIGVSTRAAGVTAAAAGYLVATQDPLGFNMTLHTLFLAAIVLGFTDAGARLALRPRAVGSAPSGTGLVRIWVASIYVWAGIAKLHADWMSGGVLDTLVHDGILRGPFALDLLDTAARRAAVAPVVAFGEIGLGLALLARPSRRAALVVAFVVHAVFQAALAPDLFGLVMAALLLAFVGDLGPWRGVFPRVSHA